MTYKTKGIVLRIVKYGETSLIVTIFTELFGVQSYMVNGVRSSSRKNAKGNYFLPGAILDLVVYHNEQKSLHRIKEFQWAYLYQHAFSDVIKNCIVLYMVELLTKSLKQPEQNADLFNFCEDVLKELDETNKITTANMPLFFTLHLTHFLGFKMIDNYSNDNVFLDLQEGCFEPMPPTHNNYIDGEKAHITSQLLKILQPFELEQIKLNKETRRELLSQYQSYYALHISDFGQMKTLTVLHEVL
ncbi:DNA repair protein RecO [Ferruginibacter lapsinanis]|uniref:DNA repair protein RecO n=1 Tax=Ferruginibacter lapsinanis TaxID=563172 RepID=UPI001E40A41A|nr:DNA repair protein RecO [Ferruginibacter lapsinanis]UEG50959.1 DNA repair protein RecO [Ferruginibacter lapsinanis]